MGRAKPHGLRLPPAVDLATALCVEAAGDPAAALTLFDRASAAFAALTVVWEQAGCLVGRGRCLVALGRTGEAGEPITRARAMFAQLGAAPSVAECDALLAETSTRAAGGTP